MSDKPLTGDHEVPAAIRTVIDPHGTRRLDIPAVPWFLRVDATGVLLDSFAVAASQDLSRVTTAVRTTESDEGVLAK